VIEKLLQHGIAVEELTTPLQAEVDVFTIGSGHPRRTPVSKSS